MPNKSMSNYKHPVLFAKLNKTIRSAEVSIPARFWMELGCHFKTFSAVMLLNCLLTIAAPWISCLKKCRLLSAAPIMKSFLKTSFSAAVFCGPCCKPYRNKGGKHTQCG